MSESFDPNKTSSTFGSHLTATSSSFVKATATMMSDNILVNMRLTLKGSCKIDIANAVPAMMNSVAVIGFIATNPGRMRFNCSRLKLQPIKTRVPTQIAVVLAIAGHTASKAGGFRWDCALDFSDTKRKNSKPRSPDETIAAQSGSVLIYRSHNTRQQGPVR